jgi:hypothetical protein
MPNKIDITQTNVQLSSSISVWSGSNLTGPAQSVPIYDASGTASIAQSVSDEYYLVRRNGIIQWAPILASVGSGLSFAFSEFSEESFNESYGSVVFRGSPIRMTNSSDNDLTTYNPIRKVYRVVSTTNIDPTFYQTSLKRLRSVSTDETDVDTTFYQTARKSLRSVSTDETDIDPTFYQTARKSLRSVSTDETDVDTTFYQTTRRYIIIYDFNVSFESIIKLNVDKTINVLDGSFV